MWSRLLSIKPKRKVGINEPVDLAVTIAPQGIGVNGSTVHLHYDPALIEVLAIAPTAQLPVALAEPFIDETNGIIRFSNGLLGNTISAPFNLATITIKAKSATAGTTITFVNDFPATTVSGLQGAIATDTTSISIKTRMENEEATEEHWIYLPSLLK